MRGIDKFRLRKAWEKHLWSKLLEGVEKSKSQKACKNLLEVLLTETEKKVLAKRLATLSLLKEGRSYKDIEKTLWTSSQTISALKKSLRESLRESLSYQSGRYYHKGSNAEKRKRTKGLPPLTVLDYWLNFPWPKKVGRGRWKFLNYQ